MVQGKAIFDTARVCELEIVVAVHVGVLTITLSFDEAFSLKDKRAAMKSLIERARRELHISIAEVGFQNQIRTGEVAAAFIGVSRTALERAREAAERMFESDPRARVASAAWEWL